MRFFLSSLSCLARRAGIRSNSSAMLFWLCMLFPAVAGAQARDHSSRDLPDAPTAAAETAPRASSFTGRNSTEGQQTKRILGIVPNFQSVSADTKLPQQTVKEKFMDATDDSFDYSAFIFAGALAGISQVSNSVPEFHQGAAGCGRYYWHTFADQTDENYMVEFVFPTVLHQDGRYYTLGHGGFAKRLAYSFSRVLITRTDSGRETFNASEIPRSGRSFGNLEPLLSGAGAHMDKNRSTLADECLPGRRDVRIKRVLARHQ
jgi:hypothetical protein